MRKVDTRKKPQDTAMTRDQLEAELLKGLNSGPAVEMTHREWQKLRDEVEAGLSKERQAS